MVATRTDSLTPPVPPTKKPFRVSLNGNHESPASAAQANPARAAGLVQCAGCGSQCEPSVRFCGECGARMWEPCAACGETNPVDKKFCGGCGASLAEALETARQAAIDTLERADAHAEQGRFAEAIKMLDSLELPDHTSLAHFGETATQKSAEIARRREDVALSASERLVEARELAERGAIREALAAAKQVPPALRGLELRQLHDDLEERLAEVDRLRKVVKEALAEKDYETLSAAVSRLLEIDSTDAKMIALREKLAAQQAKVDQSRGRKKLKSALAALKKCDYRAAAAALEEVPAADFDEKAQKALLSARERVWLAHQLARAPFVDGTLIAIADRLVKLQSHDEKVAQLRQELTRRWKDGLRKHPGQPISWGKSGGTEDSWKVSPAELPAEFAKLLAAKGHSPGQFMVAFGLALQAAGAAEMEIDLAPRKRGWGEKLLGGKGRKKKPRKRNKKGEPIPAWGIDVGAHSLKAVRVIVTDDGHPVVEDFYLASSLPGENEAGQAADSPRAGSTLPPGAAAAVQRLLEQHDLAGADVAVGMPGALTLGRFFKLPWLSEAKFDEAVRYEARVRIPLDPEDVNIDYIRQEVEAEDTPDDAEDDTDAVKVMRVALIAANAAHVEERLDLFRDAGAGSLKICGEGVALANAWLASGKPPEATDKAVAVVDIGAKTTTVAILSREGCWFRGVYAGAAAFDQDIVKQLKLSWQKAEDTRCRLSNASWMHEVDAALAGSFDQVAEQVDRAVTQFENEEGQQVASLVLCGGAAEQYGVLRRFASGE